MKLGASPCSFQNKCCMLRGSLERSPALPMRSRGAREHRGQDAEGFGCGERRSRGAVGEGDGKGSQVQGAKEKAGAEQRPARTPAEPSA